MWVVRAKLRTGAQVKWMSDSHPDLSNTKRNIP